MAEPRDDREWRSPSGVLSQELSLPFPESLPEHVAAWFWTTVWREAGARLTGPKTVESHLRSGGLLLGDWWRLFRLSVNLGSFFNLNFRFPVSVKFAHNLTLGF